MNIEGEIDARIHHFARRNQQMPNLLIIGNVKLENLVMGLKVDARFQYLRTAEGIERYRGLQIIRVREPDVLIVALGDD